MATNVLSNAKVDFSKYPVSSCYGWSGSTRVLFWSQDNNVYMQFISSRVQKMKQQSFRQWNYILAAENFADIGSKGCKRIDIKSSWINVQRKLPDWPKQITIQASQEPDNEMKSVKEILRSQSVWRTSYNISY